jgi:hypothetical protein
MAEARLRGATKAEIVQYTVDATNAAMARITNASPDEQRAIRRAIDAALADFIRRMQAADAIRRSDMATR